MVLDHILVFYKELHNLSANKVEQGILSHVSSYKLYNNNKLIQKSGTDQKSEKSKDCGKITSRENWLNWFQAEDWSGREPGNTQLCGQESQI